MKRWSISALLSVSILLIPLTQVDGGPIPGYCKRPNPPPSCAAPTASPTPSGAPTPTATPTPSGEWTLIFDEPFNQDVPLNSFPSAVSSRWFSYPYPATTLGGYYWPERVVSWHDGYMDLWLHQDAETGRWITAAPIPILDGSGTDAGKYQTYGRYEARWFVPSGLTNFYGVPLLWPQAGNYLTNGEVASDARLLVAAIGWMGKLR